MFERLDPKNIKALIDESLFEESSPIPIEDFPSENRDKTTTSAFAGIGAEFIHAIGYINTILRSRSSNQLLFIKSGFSNPYDSNLTKHTISAHWTRIEAGGES